MEDQRDLVVVRFFAWSTLIVPSGIMNRSGAVAPPKVTLPAVTFTSAPPEAAKATATVPGSTSTLSPSMATESPSASTLPVLPLLIANLAPNSVVPPQSVHKLAGTAAIGVQVEARDRYIPTAGGATSAVTPAAGPLLGTAKANADGKWELTLGQPLLPGQHVITVRQAGQVGQIQAATASVVINVLPLGTEGPLSLATPAIRVPALAARLANGSITFAGTGLPGMPIRLYLNNSAAGDAIVSAQAEWRVTLDRELQSGVYVARVTALNPQGAIVAESAPVAFVVVASPTGQLPQAPAMSIALPLVLTNATFGGTDRRSLVVTGYATPHAIVSAWLDSRPLLFVNASLDGRWRMWLTQGDWQSAYIKLELRTELEERIMAADVAIQPATVMPRYAPVLLAPQAGETLTTRRPLILGVAQPASQVLVVVNRVLVARVLSDTRGQWAYQLADPLPSGQAAFTAFVRSADELVTLAARPVLVNVAPQM